MQLIRFTEIMAISIFELTRTFKALFLVYFALQLFESCLCSLTGVGEAEKREGSASLRKEAAAHEA